MQSVQQKTIIWSLKYAMMIKRVDFAFDVDIVSQHMSKTKSLYQAVFKRIMKY